MDCIASYAESKDIDIYNHKNLELIDMVRMSTREEDISFEVKKIHDKITLGVDPNMY